MINASKGSSKIFTDNPDRDTVEFEFRPERTLDPPTEHWRAQAADPLERKLVSTSHLPPPPRQTAHATNVRVSLSIAAVLGMAAAAVAVWPTEQRAQTARQAVAPALPAQDGAASSPTPTEPAAAQNSPTRFINPFDASEAFEFPPGTTEDTARASVAEALLQRARERRTQIVGLKRGHRSTSLQAPAT